MSLLFSRTRFFRRKVRAIFPQQIHPSTPKSPIPPSRALSFRTVSSSSSSTSQRTMYRKISYVSNSELRLMLDQQKNKFPGADDVEIIDVRDEDREDGWIPGSVWVPSSTYPRRLDELVQEYRNSGKTLVFHCMFSQSRGPRCARLFCDRLQDTDNVKVFILEGGFGKWEHDQRDMVETPASAAHHGQGPMVGPKNFYVYGEGAVSQEQKEQGGQKGDGGGD